MQQSVNHNKWRVLVIVLIGSFMTTLDINIVNVALPKMSRSLSVGINDIQWIVTSYLIVVSSLVLIFGRIADIIGKKKIYQNGFLVFSFGSLLCALSNNMPFLLVSRIIQGIGASMMMSCNFGIITLCFPQNERGRAVGILGTIVAIGTMAGPTLGGFLVSLFSWQSIFYINIPIGITAYIAGSRILPKEKANINIKTFDIIGAVLLSTSILPLFYALLSGEDIGWTSPLIIICLILFLFSFSCFVFTEKHSLEPMVDLKLFKNKLFSEGIFCAFISYEIIYFTNILQPFYLQHVLNMSPGKAGLLMTVYPLTAAIFAPLSGYISDKIGYKLPCLLGLIATGLGIYSMSFLTQNSNNVNIMLRMCLLGLGYGMFQSPNTAGVMSSVPKNKLGITGSLNSLTRTLGMTFGISLSTALFYNIINLKLGYVSSGNIPANIFIYSMSLVYKIGAILTLPGIIMAALRYKTKSSRDYF